MVHGITSLTSDRADAARLLALVRGHWAIENGLHWVREVTFDEDRSQVRTGAAPQVLAALRNTAIGLFRLAGATAIRPNATCPTPKTSPCVSWAWPCPPSMPPDDFDGALVLPRVRAPHALAGHTEPPCPRP